MMKKKMMSAGGNMKKKGYAAGGMTKKGYAAGGLGMKKKMMSAGGMPMAKDPKTGKMMPKFAMDGVGKMAKGGSAMYKKGYAAGGVAMKKKMMAGGGMSTSEYDITKAKMPGSTKSTRNVSTKKKTPVVTKDRLNKLGMTLREFKNAYEVNPAGTGYVKRKRALKPKSGSNKIVKPSKTSKLLSFLGGVKPPVNRKETDAEKKARLNKNKQKVKNKKRPINFNVYR